MFGFFHLPGAYATHKVLWCDGRINVLRADNTKMLTTDTLLLVCSHLRLEDVISFLMTDKEMRRHDGDELFGYLMHQWYSPEFLRKASARYYAPRLSCVKDELCRIERFQRVVEEHEGRRWKDEDFFSLWRAEATYWRRKKNLCS